MTIPSRFSMIFAGLLFLILASTALGAGPSAPIVDGLPSNMPSPPTRRETRALWVVRYALGSPESIQRIVRIAVERGFNTLIVQVRGRGDAYYLGGLEPRSEFLDGQPADFDPLSLILREAHAAGIEVHAWLNAFFVWSGSKPPRSPRHVVNAHPEWLLADDSGIVQYIAGADREGAYLNPGHPDARRFIHDVFLDVARRYDVDGIHFDYIRYPGSPYGFSEEDLARFRASIVGELDPIRRSALDAAPERNVYPRFFRRRWNQWRRDNVTDLVRGIQREIKRIKPNVVVSAALIPWGIYSRWSESDAYRRVNQDWFGWMKEGLLDAAVPMTYHTDTSSFAGWVEAAVANRHSTAIWAGIGSYLIPPESTAEKIAVARRLGAQGFSLFSYDSITRDGQDDGYLRRVEELAWGESGSTSPTASKPESGSRP